MRRGLVVRGPLYLDVSVGNRSAVSVRLNTESGVFVPPAEAWASDVGAP